MENIIMFLPVLACLLIIISHILILIIVRDKRHMPECLLDGSVVTAYSIFFYYYVEHISLV